MTDDGTVPGWRYRAWRVADVRAAERALMARLPDGALMRRAAAGLARRCAVMLRERGGVYGARVVLLVGPGDNGGDALYAGALLAARGARVEAYYLRACHPEGMAALRAGGGRIRAVLDTTRIEAADLVVDGLLGLGGRGGLRPDYHWLAHAAAALRAAGAPVVAVDLPSGVDADTGAVTGEAVAADVTVTFGCLKPGLLVGAGAVHAGLVELVDIGLAPELRTAPALEVVTLEEVARCWPRPHPGDDKYSRGVVGVATGSATYPGVAVLSVGGALAGPAGYVRYAGAAADAVRTSHPEVVCTDTVAGAGRVQAWVVGSGLGTDEAAERTVREVLGTDVPVLLDADAITIVARHPGWVRDRAAPVVLTPHAGEYARLAGPVCDDRLAAARRLHADLGAVVLLKGHHTVVVGSWDGCDCCHVDAWVETASVPDLATAGSGDVLSGLAGSLLAAGVAPGPAAAHAAFVHGLAGRQAAATGPLTATRLLTALPPTIATIWTTGGLD